jgi:hypothetical protein
VNKFDKLMEELERLTEYEGMNRMEQLVRCRQAVGQYLAAKDGVLVVTEK